MTPHVTAHIIERGTDRDGRRSPRRRSISAGLALAVGAAVLAACGGSAASSAPTTGAPTATAPPGSGTPTSTLGGPILPVTSNPISNTSTDQVLTIDSVLVENNVDAAGNAASDHLEIALTNTGTVELSGFEVYYTYDDTTAGLIENYYAKLPADFTIAPGASRTVHFDDTGAPDHFADNQFSLYHTSVNAMDVTVEVSATGAAPQTMTVQKDKGGDEVAD
jgi:hypothetical protein